METSKDRLKKFVESGGESLEIFCKNARVSLKDLMTDFPIDEIELRKINEYYPFLNLHWLITGNGQHVIITNTKNDKNIDASTGIQVQLLNQIQGVFEIEYRKRFENLNFLINEKIKDNIPISISKKFDNKNKPIEFTKSDSLFDDDAPF